MRKARMAFGDWLTFNRTSMESKLYSGMSSRLGSLTLLIEPVWNRNENIYRFHDARLYAFNRTSMESKHTL